MRETNLVNRSAAVGEKTHSTTDEASMICIDCILSNAIVIIYAAAGVEGNAQEVDDTATGSISIGHVAHARQISWYKRNTSDEERATLPRTSTTCGFFFQNSVVNRTIRFLASDSEQISLSGLSWRLRMVSRW